MVRFKARMGDKNEKSFSAQWTWDTRGKSSKTENILRKYYFYSLEKYKLLIYTSMYDKLCREDSMSKANPSCDTVDWNPLYYLLSVRWITGILEKYTTGQRGISSNERNFAGHPLGVLSSAIAVAWLRMARRPRAFNGMNIFLRHLS